MNFMPAYFQPPAFDLGSLVSRLPERRGLVLCWEKGQTVQRPYVQLHADIRAAQDKLRQWGVQTGMRIGIQAENSYSWLVFELALQDMRAVSVPFTNDFSGAISEEILAGYGIELLLISSAKLRDYPHGPHYVASIDGPNQIVATRSRAPGQLDDDDDVLSLAFSSGSAGGLKGLTISRSGVECNLPPIMDALRFKNNDSLLLFLPMSNFQQRLLYYTALWYDFDLIITDYTQLFAAMKRFNPTVLVAPPMLYQLLQTQYAGQPQWRRAFQRFLSACLSYLPSGALRLELARRLFPRFYGQFGRSLRLLITGMAPLGLGVAQFFDSMHLPFCETYGLVETGSLTLRLPGCRRYGSVGKPLPGASVRLAEDGEIIATRRRLLTTRYFQCAEGENERTFIGLHTVSTGDIGRFDEDGFLYLLGRKRELIVTPGGLKIHPEVVERELDKCKAVTQSAVFLKPGARQLSCVVSLRQPVGKDSEGLVRAFIKSMTSTKNMPIGEVAFAVEPFSQDNGMLRPNLKLDRRRIAERYGWAPGRSHAAGQTQS